MKSFGTVMYMMVLSLVSLTVKAQEAPEEYSLWPNGPKENNGLANKETVEADGNIRNNSTAKLFVYHPEKEIQNGMTVVICPGGGYSFLSMEYEGRMFARWLTGQGITAIILQYRMPAQHDKIPLADAQRAIRWVRSRAENWGIDPNKIGIAGFSAGGHLASTLSTHFDRGKANAKDRLESFSCRPDFTILFYPVISMKEGLTHKGSREGLIGKTPSSEKITNYSNELQVTAQTPPAFLVHSDDDKGVPVSNSVAYYQALKKYNIPAVMYIFPTGGHGWGLRNDFEYYPAWTSLLKKWLGEIGK